MNRVDSVMSMSGVPRVTSTVAVLGLTAGFLAARWTGWREFGGDVLPAGHNLANLRQPCAALAAARRKL